MHVSEELTDGLVLELLETCFAAFPTHAGMKSNPRGTVHVYREGLHGLGGDAVRAAVRLAISTGKFFPKIAELRETANEWTRRNSVEIDRQAGDELSCPVCHTRARWLDRWRPVVDALGYFVTSPDGRYVRLERYERLLCRCAVPCVYAPLTSAGEPYMALTAIAGPSRVAPARPAPKRLTAGAAPNVGDVAEGLAETVLVHGQLQLPARVVDKGD